jgi:DNA-binding beta-propeller fold protein YncE
VGRGFVPVRALLFALLLTIGGALALSASAHAAGEPTTTHAFSAEKSFAASGKCELLEPGGVAIDEATHDIFVYDRGANRVDWFHADGTCVKRRKAGKGESGEEEHEGIAVDNSGGPSSGDVYVVNTEEGGVIKYHQEGGELVRVGFIKKFKNSEKEEFELEEIHGISVDSSGNLWVYAGEVIDEFNNEAKFVASVEVFAGSCGVRPGFALAGAGEAFYLGRERENRKEECEEPTVMLKANSAGEAAVEPPFAAQLDLQATSGVAVDRNTGEVYFDNKTSIAAFGADESFIERFGQGPSDGNLRESTGVAVDSATNEVVAVDAAEGRIDVFVPGSAPAKSPGTATNGLPDGRAYEQVSPQNKFAASIFPISTKFGAVQAAANGESITYTATGAIVAEPSTNRAIEPSQNLSKRAAGGWSTEAIGSPHGAVPNGIGKGLEYEFFTEELTAGFLTPSQHGVSTPTESLLAPEASEATTYKRTLATPSAQCEPLPSSCYQALVNPHNFSGSGAFGNKINFGDGTPDGSAAVLYSSAQLTAQPIGLEALYEWHQGELQLVSVLPEGEGGPPQTAKLGGAGQTPGGIQRHAINDQGTRVAFSAEMSIEEGGALYLRDTSKHETIRLDKAQGGAPEPETAHALFQTADKEGTKIFFTDTVPLLPNSTSTAGFEEEEEQTLGHGDLYVCEILETAGKLGCHLEDLTAKGTEGSVEGAEVQGVLGAGEDGTYVYFVADGVFGEAAGPGKCTPMPEETLREEEFEGRRPVRHCNLYVSHRGEHGWGAPKLVASLTSEDSPDWQAIVTNGALGRVTSRVSPNGLHVAFMSNSSLTGYDNRASNPEANNARAFEVFTYDAGTELLSCPSCNPSGARPHAVLDRVASGEGSGLLVDRSENWSLKGKPTEGRWLAANIPGWTGAEPNVANYQSRYLADSGRLFFTSADALVEGDKNGKMDVYEFDPPGEGGCASATGCVALISTGESPQESTFLDASVSGNDVFILTAQQLVKQDIDSGYDVYDARVCGSAGCLGSPAEPPPHCAAEVTCKVGSAGVPAAPGVPATAAISGPGNSGTVRVLGETAKGKPKPKPLTRAQKLKRALAKCKKIKKQKKRKACIKQANKRYGAHKKSKGKKAATGGSHG